MKKITFSIIGCLSFLFGSAQYEPDTKFLQESMWQSVMPHDSLVYSSDTGANFSADEIASMNLFPDGLIKNMGIYDPNLSYNYNSVRLGNLTTIYAMDLAGAPDTNAMFEFYKNSMGQDSLLNVYYDDGFGNLEFNLAFEMAYNSAGLTTNFFVLVDIFGTGSTSVVNDYQYHYNSNNLRDSVTIQTIIPGGMEGKIEFVYDSSDRLVQFDFYELDQNDELVPSDRYYFKHNAQGEINEVIELYYDDVNSVFELSASWKYYKKQGSGISTPEKVETNNLHIYPNPAKDHIGIYSSEKFTEYSIMNLTGQLVQEGDFTNKISLSDLKKGIYIISLKSKDNLEIRKFQKL